MTTTKYKFVASVAFSVGCLIAALPTAHAERDMTGVEIVTNGPRINPGDRSGSGSAQLNVGDSQRYDALLNTNRSFRANRMQKECGPIGDRRLHADCVASFGADEGSYVPSGYRPDR